MKTSRALRTFSIVWVASLSLTCLFSLQQHTQAATSEQFEVTAPMIIARQDHTATVLPDGRVLVTGGRDASGPLALAEIFDPSARTFSLVGSMTTARFGHAATLLPDG